MFLYVSWARSCLKETVNIAGGCCGTTPEHIRLLSPAAHGARSGESKTFIGQ
ncbi:MAG: homocysteine S-methyltransferase family protein [Muribaculaceae bacterium]|nr:homocysteine S-methyltransferase family protein [Muribaculaceae bacterium]